MKRNWMNKLLLAVFLITMVSPVPVQAKAITDQADEMPLQSAGGGIAPVAVGTPVPVMAVGDAVDSAPAPVQLDAPVSAGRKMASTGGSGVGWYDDPSGDISWTGTWSTLNSGNALGGSYKSSTTLNSTVSMTFEATQISLIFAKAPSRGSVEIKIDGNLVTTLAMSNTTEQWQQRWDSPIQADTGPHTILLTHSVAGEVVIDAFEVTNPDPDAPLGQGHYEDYDSHFQYSGDWTAWSGTGPSAGGNHYSATVGDIVSVDFYGNQISLYYTGYVNRGVADIYIDDVKVASLNQYSASLEFQKRWQSEILDGSGPHTLEIEHASGAYIDIDALEIQDLLLPDPVGPGTYEDNDPNMVYIGDWTGYNAASASGGNGHYSNSTGNYALLRFTGTQVNLKYTANVNNGNAEIRIDGTLVHTLDQYAGAPAYQQQWMSPLLADEGPHTVTVTHASGTIIDVDAMIVSNPTTPGVGTYEDTSPLIAYSGNWNPYDHASASDGSSRYSGQTGSTAQFSFEGTQISLVYTGLSNRGMMDVYIDGSLLATVNQNTSGLAWQQQWDSPVLDDSGPHTLQLIHSSGAVVDLDAIIVSDPGPTPTPTASPDTLTEGTYDDTEPRIGYSGTWTIYSLTGAYDGGSRYSEGIGDTVTFEFFGTQLSLLYTGYGNRGDMTIQIDSQIVDTLNQYTPGVTTQNRWDSAELDNPGPHSIVLTHATGLIMDLDAVIITGGGEVPTPTETSTATVSVTFTPTATPDFDPPDGKEVYRSSYSPDTEGDNPESASANLDSYGDSITGNGQYTVFSSMASNLIYGDNACETTGFSDIYLHNRQNGINECLSTMLGAAVNDESVDPFISDTGQFVVFASRATSFTSGSAPAGIQQIYLLNRVGNEILPVSVNDSEAYADADSYDPYVTSDGQYIIFSSVATNLVTGDTNGVRDVFIRDMGDRGPDGSYSGSGQSTIRVSVANDGSELTAGDTGSIGSFLSDDGLIAVFTSDSSDLTGDGTGSTTQVFYRDLDAGTTSLVSKNGSSNPGNDDSWAYGLTTEGSFVMFYSDASDLVTGGNTTEDAYVYDMASDTITQISLPSAQAIDPFPAVEGGKIAFETTKALMNEDTNGVKDVYVRKSDGTTVLASLPIGATNTGIYASYAPAISSDGRFVIFTSMVNALDPVDNPPSGGEPNIDNLYIRQIDGRWEGPTAGFYHDDDSNISYSGSWLTEAGDGAYNGDFHYSGTVGSSATFSFKGRQISLVYAGFNNRGSVEIKINGQVVDTLDQYTPTLQWKQRWSSPLLANNGPHTIVITHKTAGVVTLDGLEVSDTDVVGPGIYDDGGGQIQFQGDWADWPTTGPYKETLRYSNDTSATASLKFYGMQVSLIYTKYTTRGDIQIQIDDAAPVTLDQHSESLQWQARWDSPDLDEGIHTITLSHPGGTHYIDVDALIVTYPAYELDPPSPIEDLVGATGDDMGSVDLTWTATGDDFENGTASQYIVRYSTSEFTSEAIWEGAADVDGEPVPQIAGSSESMTVTGLTPGQFYYFTVRARDDGANMSELGNSAGATSQSNSSIGAGTYDDNNANIIYSGTWSLYSSTGPYNDSLHLSNVPGSTASFTFTGTQIGLIYTQYSSRGTMEIVIDDGAPITIDLNGSLAWQQRWDSPTLQPGTHTIVFRHPGHAKYVDIDALVVTNPESIPPVDVGDLVAQTGPDKGSIDLSWTAPGDDGVTGTATEYIFRYADSAITTQGEWDAATDMENEPVPSVAGTNEQWRVSGLDPTKTYYFAMRAKDDADNMSGISNSADAQPNMPAAVGLGTYDNPSDDILYTGTWEHYDASGPYNSTLVYTNVEDNKAVMQFTGTMVSLIYTKYTSRGTYEIIIDDGTPITLNAYSTALQWQQRWDSPLLSSGTHTLVIRHPGGSHYIDVDAIVVSEPEDIAPAAISDLSAASGAALGSISLNWTAPGDDNNTGTASSYTVRYADSAIDSQAKWDAATDVSGEPAPVAAGGAQTMLINSLVPGQTYYFAIRTEDDVPNESGLSNSPSAAAKSPDPVGAGTYDDAGGSIAYVGSWETQNSGSAYGSTMHFSNSTDAEAYFSFNGDQFTLVFTGYSSRGDIAISIDGGAPILVNQYTTALSWQQEWTSPDLGGGTHNISFSHPGGSGYIDIDAIIVTVMDN